MNTHIRHLVRGGAVALMVLWCAGAAWAQENHAHDDAGHAAASHEGADQQTSTAPEPSRGLPPAELTEAQIELVIAGAAHLYPLLPHDKGGQPGSAVEGMVLLGSAVDSIGQRGKVELSEEEAEALVAGLMRNAIRARFCGVNCSGAYGDAAVTFHVPRVEGDAATVWVLTFWAIGQLPDRAPDRALYRGDELQLRRQEGRWVLVKHTKLREELRFMAGAPGEGPARTID